MYICVLLNPLKLISMTYGITDNIIGKRIRLIQMKDDPFPVENGTYGTIVNYGSNVINVEWDNGRTLGVIIDLDEFEIYFENQ